MGSFPKGNENCLAAALSSFFQFFLHFQNWENTQGTLNPVSRRLPPPSVFRLYVTRSALSNLSPGVRCCVSSRQLTLWNTPPPQPSTYWFFFSF
jgi:hypothetical protein